MQCYIACVDENELAMNSCNVTCLVGCLISFAIIVMGRIIRL